MRSKKLFTVFLALAGLFLFALPPAYALTDVSATTAYNALQSDPTAVIFDTRSVDEYNGLIPPWTGTPGTIDTNSAYNGTPKWRAGGKTKLPISLPFWRSAVPADTTQLQDAAQETEVRNILEGLLARGVIDFNTPIYLLCRTAWRSHYMGIWIETNTFYNAKTGVTATFTNLYDIDADGDPSNGAGGMEEWNRSTLPKYMGTSWSGYTYTPPIVFAEFDGNTTFTVSVLEPTPSAGFTWPTVNRVSLQIFDSNGLKGSEVAYSTSDTTGALWTDYTFDASTYPFDIPLSYTWRAYAANNPGWGLANNSLGVTDISAAAAKADAEAGKGVIVDVRTWAEHQGCADTGWNPFTYDCASTAPNARSPQWTDTATGVVHEAINVPFWISDGGATTGWLPDDETSFTNSFNALKQAGVIDFNTRLYVLCKSGYRSYWAGVYLKKLGFRNVYNVDGADTYASGGMLEWYASGLPANTDFHGPQVYAISPADGYANAATGQFKVGILEVPRAQGKGHPCVTNVDLYVDNFGTPVATSTTDTVEGTLWTEYTFTNTPAAGSHTWNVRAQSGWGNPDPYGCAGALPTYTMWNSHAYSDGPGDRSLGVSTQIAVTDSVGTTDDLELNFGDLNLGSTSTTQTITVANNGGSTLTGLSTSLTTYSAVSFLPFTFTNNCGSSLGAGANCTIDVTFSPTKAGSFGKILRINSDDATVPQVAVAVCGTGGGTAPRWVTATDTADLSDSDLLSLLSDCAVPAAVSSNSAPSAPTLVAPEDGAVDVSTDVTFAWTPSSDADGDDISYQVCYAPDGEDLVCHDVDGGDVASAGKGVLYAGLGSGLLLFGIVAAGSDRRRKLALLVGMTILTAMFLVSCGKNTDTSSTGGTSTDSYGVSGLVTYSATLDADTTYNWKVIASDGSATAESGVATFTTGGN
ncbi:MAG TPA: choice-of-anchor D domain-containing protein [Nitrospirae bacterium]|nr:choice-of-anchor D domain-containing protein [Nitrospirota bacterium]